MDQPSHFSLNLTLFFVALITVFYYGFCSSLSGFSVNPARSFSSAFFASVWDGIWIYFLAPAQVCSRPLSFISESLEKIESTA